MTLYDYQDERHYKNEFADFSWDSSAEILSVNHQVHSGFKTFLVKKIEKLLSVLNKNLSNLNSKDITMYTGLSGIAYLYYKLSKASELNEIISRNALKDGDHLVQRCLRHLTGRAGSIMTADTGPLIMSVLFGIEKNSHEKIMAMYDYVTSNPDIPDEILYGKSGYLAALLMMHKFDKSVDIQIIKKLFKSIVNSGLKLAKIKRNKISNMPPLFYEWHGKPYLGAAHGMSGIIFMLLQVYLEESLSEIHSSLKQDIDDYIYPTIEFLCQLRLPSGNYPSSIGESSKRDVLIHWCHGAPGWIHLFIAAHRVYKHSVYMERMKEIGEVIWKRGLLYKGCGICHGSAGNGYAFLALYQYTNDPKYLYRALKFAQWCTDYSTNRTRESDRPFSLFEGLAGTLNFLVDCLDPHNAKFPVYEV